MGKISATCRSRSGLMLLVVVFTAIATVLPVVMLRAATAAPDAAPATAPGTAPAVPVSITVLGQSVKPGQYSLEPNHTTVGDAFTLAGPVDARFDVSLNRPGPDGAIETLWTAPLGSVKDKVLQPGDIVVVERERPAEVSVMGDGRGGTYRIQMTRTTVAELAAMDRHDVAPDDLVTLFRLGADGKAVTVWTKPFAEAKNLELQDRDSLAIRAPTPPATQAGGRPK